MRPRIDHVTRAAIDAGLARVRERVAAAAAVSGRAAEDVAIVAAVKYVDDEACRMLAQAGIGDLAESRFEQLAGRLERDVAVAEEVRWHFIGRLQSRQAAAIAERVAMVHTLCSERAAARLAAGTARPELLVQVNVDGDPAKDGLVPSELERFLERLPVQLVVRGLMAMPAFAADPEQSRGAFARLRELRDELAPRLAGRHELALLSMGTSQDYAVAVEEGATHVRLGRILYAGGE